MDIQDEAFLRTLRMVLDVDSLSLRIAIPDGVVNLPLTEEMKQAILDAAKPDIDGN